MPSSIPKRHYSIDKPPTGVQIDWGHPLAQGIQMCVLFNELGGAPLDLVANTFLRIAGAVSPTWTVGVKGPAGKCTATSSRWDFTRAFSSNALTVACIRRKIDTTARACASFGATASANSDFYNPWSDGIVYWDFGGQAGANRLTWSGYSISTQVEHWVFVGGSLGSAIYLNGIQRANQSTAITQSSASLDWSINYDIGQASGDLQEFFFFGIWNTQWSAATVAQWNAEPYGLLYNPAQRFWSFPSVAAAGPTTLPVFVQC
jgi:hypothetical protein